ncbi:proton-conducting transporter transmembrane domain-containing protein [Larkinella humicola]|uniref:NADH-quinone oxidoreductase subunit E n=1 Tax=Larkinella humicola TaxID=2607654 RepID=A0A5N1J9P9_9BACT|nr:proton-conducting transporter membrane subunit [Larkinella humicola]KAA9349145.1 NADH-quinone oxidoreductase subunit E [Larkinella humicola]
MESAVFIFTAGCSLGVFLFRGQTKYYFSLFLHILLIVTASSWAFRALSAGGLMQFNLLEQAGFLLPVNIDSLSAFFLGVISLTMLTGVLFANGYLKRYRQTQSDRQLSFHHLALLWLHLSMILVCTLRGGVAFMISWELMALAAFGLVIFEGERKDILRTGYTYLLQIQIGFAFILVAFLIAGSQGHSFGFDSFGAYFVTHKPLPVFLLLFIGFGSYAGFVPLHSWLPQTQLTAPSHVSAIMSGVLIQLGLYGILRVLTYIHTDLVPIAFLILVFSLLSGLVGIRNTFFQHDGKKWLAYSSIANTGVIGIGVGVGLLGIAFNVPALAALGFTGGILHIANHALSKSLLFFGIGSIYRATNTRNIDQLGGLIRTMPRTSFLFLLGALALCGLPPFNGFVSEFLIYRGLIKGLSLPVGILNLAIWAVFLGLILISGFTIVGFTKIFETAFLGTPRSESAAHAKEVTDDLLVPQLLASLFILTISIWPTFFLRLTGKVSALYVTDLHPIDAAGPTLAYVGSIGATLVGVTLFVLWVRHKPPKPIRFDYHPPNSFRKPKKEHGFG